MNDTDLMSMARITRERMREHEVALGLTFPPHVRLEVALDAVEAGLASWRLRSAT